MAHRTPDNQAQPSILSCGYVALDTLVEDGVLGYTAGGTAGNVAAALAFLGWQATVAAVVGADEAGTRLRRDLTRAGVSTRHITTREEASTPQVIHEIHERGHRYHFRCYECGRRLGKSLPPEADLAARILDEHPDPDVFFFDRASRFSVTLAERYAERGTIVFFEPATKGRPDLVTRAYAAATIVKCATDSATDLKNSLNRADTRTFILTDGPNGIFYRRGVSSVRSIRALPVTKVIDAAGAGDWTTTGILHALLADEPTARSFNEKQIRNAIGWGQAVAALNCTWRGARGIARVRDAATVRRDAAALLAGTHKPEPARQRFSAQASHSLCRVCLGPAAKSKRGRVAQRAA